MAEITLIKSAGMLVPNKASQDYVDGLPTGEPIAFTHKTKRKTRRNILNSLSHCIYADAAKQRGDTRAVDEKAEMKYQFGISVLTHDPEDGDECRDYYRRLLSGLKYEERIARMHEGHKFYAPVTSLMTDEQMSEYLTRILQHYAEQGIVILTPKERQWIEYPEAG